MDELADLLASSYPDCRDLLEAIRPLTVWGFAYRYPGMEDVPEPVPDQVELRRIIDLVKRLAERLESVAALGDPRAAH